ncbi:MAG: hypothetical protein EYC68_06740 [Chloroflexota bacterium]|nr:MAG: hypothetical protein EYC68_06740 [Chloroflexota bacterium]
MQNKSRTLIAILALTLLTLLACQTTALLGGIMKNNARPAPTRAVSKSSATRASTKPKATSNPNSDYAFVPSATPRCTAGGNSASIVSGQILENGNPVVGQRVQASAGEGGEPISDEPAESDQSGNYQVTFVCDGRACDASFWVWLVDEDNNQISPFVKFVFDSQCRHGTINFENP